MAKHLLIDTFTRELRVYSVSATRVAGQGVVLRFGADLGPLAHFGERLFNRGYDIIIPLKGYRAQSSEGFVEVYERVHPSLAERTWIIGIQGFPWMQGTGALRPVKTPWSVLIFRAGATIEKQRVGCRSNWGAVSAAREGHKLLVEFKNHFAYVLEGQSDRLSAFQVGLSYWEAAAYLDEEVYSSDMPDEHRQDMFVIPEAEAPEVSIMDGSIVDQSSLPAESECRYDLSNLKSVKARLEEEANLFD